MNQLLRHRLVAGMILMLCTASRLYAQNQTLDRNSMSAIDTFVSQTGPMEGHVLRKIVDSITTPCTDQYCQLRAIYVWIATNIAFDCQAYHHPQQVNENASQALNERKATSAGYADLFRQMCLLAHIRCETIAGTAKSQPKQIDKLRLKPHFWNAVCIGTTWFAVDVTWGAGTTDAKMRHFTPSFTDAWLMTDRRLFALSHYPNDRKWQLLDTPIRRPVFSRAPIVGLAASMFRLVPTPSVKGHFKTREDKTAKLLFTMHSNIPVQRVAIAWDDQKEKPVEFYQQESSLEVYVPGPVKKRRGRKHTLTLFVNNIQAFAFTASPGKRKAQPTRKKKATAGKTISHKQRA